MCPLLAQRIRGRDSTKALVKSKEEQRMLVTTTQRIGAGALEARRPTPILEKGRRMKLHPVFLLSAYLKFKHRNET